MKRNIFLFFFLLPVLVSAQFNIRDSSIRMSLIHVTYAFHLPGGEMADRFGAGSMVGLKYLYKTRKKFYFGVEGNYIFGNNVRENNTLDSISTKYPVKGIIIDQNGVPAEIRTYERGFTIGLVIGKSFSGKFSPNPNSGFYFHLKPGFISHRILIEDHNESAPQLGAEYLKGYDRLTNGFFISEAIGYQYLSNRRLVNFFIEADLMQAFTQNKRFNTDLMSRDSHTRNDLLYSIRIGWILPLYKKAPNDFYYN